jgi:hypothetical protein
MFWKRATVYFLAHFCPVAFSRQMIALKITLKKTHFLCWHKSVSGRKECKNVLKNHTFLNSCIIWEAVELEMVFYKP